MNLIRKFFSTDSVLKIVSLIVAIGIWLYITTVSPVTEKIVLSVPVHFSAPLHLNSLNLAIVSEQPTIDIKLSGSRTDLANIEQGGIGVIRATVDVYSIEAPGTHFLPVSILIIKDGLKIAESYKTDLVEIEVDEIIEERMTIQIVTVGDVAEHYTPGKISVLPDTVTLRGPAGQLEQMEAVVFVNYDNTDVDIRKKEQIVLRSISTQTEMPTNPNITKDADYVGVFCEVTPEEIPDDDIPNGLQITAP